MIKKLFVITNLAIKNYLMLWKEYETINLPANGRLTKEFYETFWDEVKYSFINSIKLAYQKKALSISQHQAVKKKIVIEHCWKIGDQFPYLM